MAPTRAIWWAKQRLNRRQRLAKNLLSNFSKKLGFWRIKMKIWSWAWKTSLSRIKKKWTEQMAKPVSRRKNWWILLKNCIFLHLKRSKEECKFWNCRIPRSFWSNLALKTISRANLMLMLKHAQIKCPWSVSTANSRRYLSFQTYISKS